MRTVAHTSFEKIFLRVHKVGGFGCLGHWQRRREKPLVIAYRREFLKTRIPTIGPHFLNHGAVVAFMHYIRLAAPATAPSQPGQCGRDDFQLVFTGERALAKFTVLAAQHVVAEDYHVPAIGKRNKSTACVYK